MRSTASVLLLCLACCVHADVLPDPPQLPRHALYRIGSARLRTGPPASWARFSRDGKRLVTTGEHTVIVWDVESGERLLTIEQRHLGESRFVVGSSLLMVPDPVEDKLHIWDVDHKKRIHAMRMFYARSIGVSADGKRLLAATDTEIKAWSLPDCKPLPDIKLPVPPAGSLWSISPSGKLLVAWGVTNEQHTFVHMREIEGGGKTRSWKVKTHLDRVSLSGDDARFMGHVVSLSAERPDRAYFWSTKNDGPIQEMEVTEALRGTLFEFAHDGLSFYFMNKNREYVRREIATKKDVKMVDLTHWCGFPVAALHATTGRLALVGNREPASRIRIIDLKTRRELHPSTSAEEDLTDVMLSHDGRRLVCLSGKEVTVRDSLDEKALFKVSAKQSFGRATLFPDRPLLVVGDGTPTGEPNAPIERGMHRFYDLSGRRWLDALDDAKGFREQYYFVRDRKECALIDDVRIRWWCPEQKKVVQSKEHGKTRLGLQQCEPIAGGRLLCVYATRLEVLDLASGKVVCKHDNPKEILNARVTADGQSLCLLDELNSIWVMTIAENAEARRIAAFDSPADYLRWAPDGKQVGVLLRDPQDWARMMAVFVDPVSKRVDVLAEFSWHDWPHWMAYSPEGRNLVLCSDRSVWIYEWPARVLRFRLRGHFGMARRVQFFPGGDKLLTHSEDNAAIVWDLLRTKEMEAWPRLTVEQMWKELADSDGEKAHRAVCLGIKGRGDFVAFVRKQMPPAGRPAPAALAQAIANLDDKEFAKRSAAQTQLERWGELAVPALRKAKAGDLSIEASRRVDRLLEMQTQGRLDPESTRRLRAIEALEYNATPAAATLLKELAAGNPDARVTQDALGALERRVAHAKIAAR